jgi:hypothetical protein
MRPARRSPRLAAVAALAVALAAFPLGALASHNFADVPDSNVFHADISALAASGVTTGCGGGNFCPSAFVTREQMAAFMNRLGALAAGKTPVVNADRLDGFDSGEFLLADPVVMSQFGPWTVRSGSSPIPTFTTYASEIEVSAASAGAINLVMELTHPAVVGATSYGLSSVEVCWVGGSSNVIIFNIDVLQATTAGEEGVVSDPTDVDVTSGAGCRVATAFVLAESVGATALDLGLDFSAAGTFRYVSVRSTWVPVV